MFGEIKIKDLVGFSENCHALGVAKCRENKTPGIVVGINQGKYKTYLVDAGLGYLLYLNENDIKVRKSEKEVICQ